MAKIEIKKEPVKAQNAKTQIVKRTPNEHDSKGRNC